jgi:hypothetical protein
LTNGTIEFALDCPKSLLRELYDTARRSRKKAYFCGVLFGRRNGPVVRIEAWRGDTATPKRGGLLENIAGEAARVERVLAEAPDDAALDDFKPIGWFVARREGDLVPQAPEVELYNRLFPEPWQVTLLLRPDGKQGRARFFGRGAQPGDPLVIDDGLDRANRPEKQRSAARSLLWALALGGWLLLAGLGAVVWLQPDMAVWLLPTRLEVPLHLTAGPEGLNLTWDHDAVRVLGVWRATIDLRSVAQTKHYELTQGEISSGVFRIATPPDDTAMEMLFVPNTGAPIHSYARFLVPSPPPRRPAVAGSTNDAGERAARARVKPLRHSHGKKR